MHADLSVTHVVLWCNSMQCNAISYDALHVALYRHHQCSAYHILWSMDDGAIMAMVMDSLSHRARQRKSVHLRATSCNIRSGNLAMRTKAT